MESERKPNYEEEAEYKYIFIVLLIIGGGFLIKYFIS